MLRRWNWFPVFGALAVLGTACGPTADLGLGKNELAKNAATDIDLTPTSSSILEGQSVAFSLDLLCNDVAGQVTNVQWLFGDGQFQVGTVAHFATPDPGLCDGDVINPPQFYAADWDTASDVNLRTPTHVYADDDSYVGYVVADDDLVFPPEQAQLFDVTVANVPPVAALTAPAGSLYEGSFYNYVGSVIDPGLADDEISWVYWQFGGQLLETFDCGNPVDRAAEGICTGTNQAERTRVYNREFDDNNNYTVWLRVCDDSSPAGNDPDNDIAFGGDLSGTGCADASVVVNINNEPPKQQTILGNNEVDEGTAIDFTLSYRDPGADTQSVNWDFGDGANFSGMAETVTNRPMPTAVTPGILTPSHIYCNANAGANHVQVLSAFIIDEDLGLATATKTITIHDISPVFDLATQNFNTVDEGQTVRFDVVVTSDSPVCDPINSNSYVWSCTDNNTTHPVVVDSGCATDDTFCVCRFLDGHNPADNYTARVTVSDEDSSSSTSWTVTVNNVAPTISNLAAVNVPVTEGLIEDFTRTFDDPSDVDTYTVTWQWGDGNDDTNNVGFGAGPFTSVRNHLYAEDSDQDPPAIPPYTITLTVTDDDGGFDTETLVIEVEDVDPAGALSVNPNAGVSEGVTTVTATIAATSANASDLLSTFSIDWGDGSPVTVIPASQSTATHDYEQDGSFTAILTVSDEDSTDNPAELNNQVTIDVLNVAPVIAEPTVYLRGTTSSGGNAQRPDAVQVTVREGETVAFGGEFFDPSQLDTYTFQWTIDDGGTPVSLPAVPDNMGGARSNGTANMVLPVHSYTWQNHGTFSVTLTVWDDDQSDTYTFDVVVQDNNPTFTVSYGQINEGQTVNIAVTAASGCPNDASADEVGDFVPMDETYQVDCQGNTGGAFIATQTSAAPSLPCTFAQDSSDEPGDDYQVTVRVYDEDSFTEQVYQVVVLNVNPVIALGSALAPLDEAGTLSWNGSTFTDPGDEPGWSAWWTFTDPKPIGGGAKSVAVPATVQPGAGGVPEVTYQFEDEESGALADPTICTQLHVRDDDFEVVSPCYSFVLRNVNPVIDGVETTSPVGEGTAMNFFVTAHDVANISGPQDPLTYRYQWDDTSPDTVIVGTDYASHIFRGQGFFDVVITVTDDDGGSATWIENVEVINIPPEIIDVVTTAPKSENTEISVVPLLKSYNVGVLRYCFDWLVDATDTCALDAGTGLPVTPGNWQNSSVGLRTYAQDGSYPVTVKVIDDATPPGVSTANVTVVMTNVAPTVAVPAPAPINEGQTTTLVVTTTDPGPSDPRTFSVDWLGNNSYVVVTPTGTGPFNLASPVYADDGNYIVRVRVADDDTFTEAVTTVRVLNSAPGITNVVAAPGLNVAEGTSVTLTVTAADGGAGTDALTYAFDWNNDGAFDAVGASNNAAYLFRNNGSFTVRIRVTDDDGAFAETTRLVTVTNAAPVIGTLVLNPASPVGEGTTVTLTVPATDVGTLDTLTYGFDWNGDGTFEVVQATGIAQHHFARSGSFTVNVRVTDSDGSSDTETTTVVVNNVAPVIASAVLTPASGNINENGMVTVQVTATDAGNDALTYEFDWDGDATYDLMQATGIATHTYADVGGYTVGLRVTDSDGSATVYAGTPLVVTVSNVPPVIASVTRNPAGAIDEGGSVTVTVNASGGDGSLLYEFDWNNDGTYDLALSGHIASHTYPSSGSFTGSVRVTDEDGETDTDTFAITVNNVAPVIASAVLTPAGGNINENGSVTVQVTASDAGNDALTYEFDWDGDGAYDLLQATGIASHVYTDAGTETIGLRVRDADGAATIYAGAPLLVTIANVPPSISSVVLSSGTITEGATLTVTVNAGGGDGTLLYEYDWTADGTYDLALSGGVASHVYPTSGNITGRVRITDGDGETDTETFAVTVTNVAPVITDVTATSPVTAGSSVTVTVSATDIASDTLTYEFDWTADGTYDLSNGTGIAFHTYDSSGDYTIRVRVYDGTAYSTPDTASVTVTDLTVTLVVTATPATLLEGESSVVRVAPTGTGPYLISWDWDGDGLYGAGDDVDQVLSETTVPLWLERSHVFGSVGQPRVNVRVIDQGAGNSVAASSVTLRVNNINPTITSANGPDTATEGSLYTHTVTATDPGAAETLTFGLMNPPTGMLISSGGVITWTPTYHQAGAHTVTVVVTDPAAGTAGTSWTVTVGVIDSDGDGMADAWEVEAFGNLTTAGTGTDTDGDGVSDYDEFLAGTNPNVSDHNPPTAPVALRPVDAFVAELQPMMVVSNATDPEDDVLEYTFEVFDNEDLDGTAVFTAIVDEGTGTTSVAPDADLIDGNKYWWRARANDGIFDGPWTTTAWFVVSVNNRAPSTAVPLLPADGAGVTTLQPTLEVRAASDPDLDVLTYDFQVYSAQTPATGTLVHEVVGNGDVYWTVNTDLTEDTTYWWRARAVDEHGAAGAWSGLFSFTVNVQPPANQVPPVPVLLMPADGALVATARPTLEVRSVRDPDGDDVTYDFQVYSNQGLTTGSLVVEIAASAFEYWKLTQDLTEDTAYWWRARASDDQGGVSAWSATFMLTVDAVPPANVAPGVPVLLTPTDGSVVSTLTPMLEVRAVVDPDGDPISYDIQVYSAENMASGTLVVEVTGSDEVYWTVSEALSEDTGYWWRARASDSRGGISAWSELFGFSVDTLPPPNTAPAAPAILLPAVDATVATLRPYLEVTSVQDADGDAVSYAFRIYSNQALSTQVAAITGRGLPTWFVDVDLVDGQQYWWVATASDGVATSPSSNTGHFTVALPVVVVNTAPSAPALSAPAIGAVVTDTTPALAVTNSTDAEGDELSYYFEVANNAGFVGTTVQVSAAVAQGQTTTTWTPTTALAEDSMYYWRARASDGELFSDWTLGTFTVSAQNGAPSIPVPLSPAVAALLQAAPTHLVAQNAVDPEDAALTYTFEIAADVAGATILSSSGAVAESAGATSWAIEGVTFVAGTTYYWHVQASDGTSASGYSDWVAFTLYKAPVIPEQPKVEPEPAGGCGCASSQPVTGSSVAVLAAVVLILRRRRR